MTWTNDHTSVSDDCGASGSTTVIFTATDDCGNASTSEATFTIEDTSETTIDLPAVALTLECDAANQQTLIDAWLANNGGATADDVCSPTNLIWTNNYTAGIENTDCGASGTVLVTFTATDDCGLFVQTTAGLTIEDNTAPSIDIAAVDETVECDGAGNIVELNAWLANNGGAVASDGCGDVTWTNDHTSVSDDCGASGSTTVIFTATDDCGNTSTSEAVSYTHLTLPTIYAV